MKVLLIKNARVDAPDLKLESVSSVVEVVEDTGGGGAVKRVEKCKPDLILVYTKPVESKEWMDKFKDFNVPFLFLVDPKDINIHYIETYRTLFETTGTATVILDEDGTILQCNKEAEKLTGYSKKEIEGSHYAKFVTEEDLERMRKYHELRMKNPNLAQKQHVLRIRDRQGKTRYIQATLDMIPGTKKSIISASDVTKLKEALMERETLLREVYHRVKNNLQIISSLLNLQLGRVKEKEVCRLLKESQGRIRAMAMIHEHLYQSKSLAKINFKEYSKRLVDDIVISYGAKVKKKLEVQDISLDIDTAIPLGLIINELVTNSIKHAFPTGKGTITIKLTSKNDKIELIVSDDGVGLPENINLEKTETLGLKLVNTLTRQINGKITLKTNHGTKYKITFHLKKDSE